MSCKQTLTPSFPQNMSLCELKQFFLDINKTPIRQTKDPLTITNSTNKETGFTAEVYSTSRRMSFAIPRAEYKLLPPPILHHHDYFELLFVKDGAISMQIEDTISIYKKGDVLVLDPNVYHTEISTEDSSITYFCVTVDFLANCTEDTASYGSSDGTRLLHLLLDNTGSLGQFVEFKNIDPKGIPLILSCFRGICDELTEQEPGSLLIIRGKCCRLFSLLCKQEYYSYTLTTIKTGALVNRVRQFIDSASGRVSRGDIAAAIHYNSDYLNRLFKKHMGMTLSAYSTYSCMKKAALLLLETDDTVEEIAAAVGFTNPSQFYRQFQNHFHMSPGVYRSASFKLSDRKGKPNK